MSLKNSPSLASQTPKRPWPSSKNVKFLKDPLFVGPIYLKKPGRVEALAYVLLIALLIFGILERRVREAMKNETEPLIIPGKVKTFSPTGKKILEAVETVLVMTTDDPYRRIFSNKVPRVLKLAGFEPDIYLDIRDGPYYLPYINCQNFMQ